ncbi:META domain-containing protein [Sphingobacterium bovistauri]|uniref:META domain-containing protein n=1 Tax=Sphingobacterium bovistauri TaxID=2781959 RepID=A0ABS7Z7D4_9SPHI|nr:META domain-containing protein [Sphingobacterium bovistauri]MCA5006065.1 META domain-containing protein [Sphingobacterium bovistauri]
MKSTIILSSITITLLSGCSILQNKTPSNASDLNAKWHIISIENKTIDKKVNGKEPIFSFDLAKQEYAAITGCNNLMGGFELKSKNNIKFTRGVSTMMACNNMEVEQGLSKILPLISSYKISNDTLSFIDTKKNIKAQFKLKHEDNSSQLQGKWELDYLGLSSKTLEQLFNSRKPTIEFDIKEETLVGNGGCNNYSGTYNVNGHKINFGAIAATKMACPSLTGEALYFQNLQKISSYSVHENQLTFITDDIAILRFKKIK